MNQLELDALWSNTLLKLQESIAQTACERWLRPLTAISLENGTLTLGTPNDLFRDYITERFITFIRDALKETYGEDLAVELKNIGGKEKAIENDAPVQQVSLMDAKPSYNANNANGDDTPEQIAPGDNSTLNPRYTFDTFVMGKSNQIAHAAAERVAEAPGMAFNPLFLYGGVGLGKTHLMHAIAHRILENNPTMRVQYVSSEKFTNELITSIRDGKQEQFRQKYRTIDVLLVDDVQFLSGKQSTQEEFFHTFNTLKDGQKQIILSSDRPPHEIKVLEERLRSRFEWGLITDIQAPDLETRIAILKKKAQVDNLDVPNDVMVYIASRIDSNIRELEGALTRVVAYASLMKREVNTELVSEALKDIFPGSAKKEVTVEVIQEMVATHFGLKTDDLTAKSRARNVAFPRQIAMYLCREMTDTSLPQIGNFFGGRDHTTVIHAYDKIKNQRQEDTKLDRTINEMMEEIQRV